MTTMPFWDWRQPLKLRRNSQELRTDLLLAVGELRVFTAALRTEIDRPEGGSDDDRPGPRQHP